MNLLWRTAFTAAAYAATCSAAVTYTPITSGPSYAVSIPQNTVSSGSGDIYFQLSAPTSYQWVGLGIGSQMAGASIFVMYADGNGNVTISPRSGSGHVEPQVDSSLKVELLAGSGVSNGVMTANVLCTSCSSKLSSTTSTSSSWIAAWNQGSALNSASVSATIAQHSGNAYRQFSLDLTKAVASADTNPFVTSVPSSGGGTATASAIRPTSTSSTNPGAPNSGDSSGVSEIGFSFAAITDYQKAHGIIMGLAVVLLFPIAAILMPLGAGIWVHAAAQMFSFALFIVGFGLGVKLADMTGLLYKSAGRTHTIFGTVILGLFFIQPVLGFLQHKHFVRNQNRGVFGHAHQWYGRILMLLSIINGGLGLKLAANSTGGKIAYSVVAAVIGVAYIGVALGAGLGKRRGGKGVAGERERERERSAI